MSKLEALGSSTHSLFQDRKIKKKTLSYWQQVAHWYDDFMFDYFPPSQDFPPLLRFPFGLIFLGGTIVIFITLFVTGFWQAQSKVFLAPIRSAEGVCKPVPVANTGTYLGTADGFWQGSVNFSFSNAAYVINMNDFSISESKYLDIIKDIENAMRNTGATARTSDLSFNLLLWSTFVLWDPTSGVTQRFYMTGEPMQILNREFTDVTMSNNNYNCEASNAVKFDANNAHLDINWDYETFSSASSHCTDMMTPTLFGFNYVNSRNNKFSMQIDMRTVMIAVAVNYGIITPSSLTLLINLRQTYIYNSVTYTVDRFVDPRYPGMSPLSCIVSPAPTMCVILLGNVPTLPAFFHTGKSFDSPEPCICHELTSAELDDVDHPCHAFNFMVGFLFYNTADPAPLFELYSRSQNNSYLNQAYLSTWYASSFGQTLNASTELRAEAFSFCATSHGNCSIMAFSFYDLYGRGYTLSRNYYQLLRGACRDSFSASPETWDRFRSTPYAPLVQRYVECQDTFWNVFTDQTGIAFGNSQLITPVFAVLLILCVMCLKRGCGYGEGETYTKNDKADAVDALAVAMLLTKEGLLQKGHADSEAGREGCIHMLVRDLEWHIEEFDEERKAFEGGEDEKSHTWIIVRDKLRGVLSLLRRPVKGAKVLDNGGGSQVYVHATSTSNMVEEGEAVEEESETE